MVQETWYKKPLLKGNYFNQAWMIHEFFAKLILSNVYQKICFIDNYREIWCIEHYPNVTVTMEKITFLTVLPKTKNKNQK